MADDAVLDRILQHRNVVALAFLAIIPAAYLLAYGGNKDKSSGKERRRRRRNLSFTSVGLGIGTFPPSARVKEPIINGTVYFDDEAPSAEDVAECIVRPLLRYDRLSHVPDLDNHTIRPSTHGGDGEGVRPMDLIRTLEIDGDDDALHETIVDHCQDALGAGRDDLPWWEILIVRNRGSGPSACVIRIHHVIGDGLALVGAFNKILTSVNGSPIKSPLDFRSGAAAASHAQKGGTSGERKKKEANVFGTAWSLVCATVHVLTLGATKYDDDTIFSRMNNSNLKHSGKRQAVLFPTVPLDFVKELKSAAGVTVNDLLMTAVSQAIRDYCLSQDDPILLAKSKSEKADVQCRALLPVGFPRDPSDLDDPGEAMRNIWCMVSCDMGIGLADIMDRLRFVHSKTQEMKSKPRAYMQLKVQNSLGPYIPQSVGQQTVFDTFTRHSLVLTNVPGPSEPVLFAGKLVKGVQLFFDNLLTQVDLMSYAGGVYGNMIFDADELPNAESFGALYAGALVDLAGRLDVDVPPEVREAAASAARVVLE